MFRFLTRRLWYVFICFFICAGMVAATPAEAATLEAFVGARDLAEQVEDYSLITATETGSIRK